MLRDMVWVARLLVVVCSLVERQWGEQRLVAQPWEKERLVAQLVELLSVVVTAFLLVVAMVFLLVVA